MGMTVKIQDGVQIIVTTPDEFVPRHKTAEAYANSTRKVVSNGVTYTASDPSKRLNPAPRVDAAPMKFQKIAHRKDRSYQRLMNCKSIDKFDYGTHPNYPTVRPKSLRRMQLAEVRAYCLAGAVITYDPWAFRRGIVFADKVLGSCTKGDIDALVRAGVVRQQYIANGYIQYQK